MIDYYTYVDIECFWGEFFFYVKKISFLAAFVCAGDHFMPAIHGHAFIRMFIRIRTINLHQIYGAACLLFK